MRDWPPWNCAYCHVLGVAFWCHQIWVVWLKERLDVLLHSEREVLVHVPICCLSSGILMWREEKHR